MFLAGHCRQLIYLAIFHLLVWGAQVGASGNEDVLNSPQFPTAVSICPSGDFKTFLDAFSESKELQVKLTNFPLQKLHVIDAEPEPKPVVKFIDRSQVTFPLIPSVTERRSRKLTVRFDAVSRHKAKITLRKEDTGYQIAYFFKKDDCWRLVRIEDWSL